MLVLTDEACFKNYGQNDIKSYAVISRENRRSPDIRPSVFSPPYNPPLLREKEKAKKKEEKKESFSLSSPSFFS